MLAEWVLVREETLHEGLTHDNDRGYVHGFLLGEVSSIEKGYFHRLEGSVVYPPEVRGHLQARILRGLFQDRKGVVIPQASQWKGRHHAYRFNPRQILDPLRDLLKEVGCLISGVFRA